jgi:hypothetical protein
MREMEIKHKDIDNAIVALVIIAFILIIFFSMPNIEYARVYSGTIGEKTNIDCLQNKEMCTLNITKYNDKLDKVQ